MTLPAMTDADRWLDYATDIGGLDDWWSNPDGEGPVVRFTDSDEADLAVAHARALGLVPYVDEDDHGIDVFVATRGTAE